MVQNRKIEDAVDGRLRHHFTKIGLFNFFSGLFFSLFFVFSMQLTEYIRFKSFTDGWIRTADLWCRKRPLYQPLPESLFNFTIGLNCFSLSFANVVHGIFFVYFAQLGKTLLSSVAYHINDLITYVNYDSKSLCSQFSSQYDCT